MSTWALSIKTTYRIVTPIHYSDVIMGTMASQITNITILYSTVYSGPDQRNIKAVRYSPLCGNSPVTCELPASMASNKENVSIWWCLMIAFAAFPGSFLINDQTMDSLLCQQTQDMIFHPFDFTPLRDDSTDTCIWPLRNASSMAHITLELLFDDIENFHVITVSWPAASCEQPGVTIATGSDVTDKLMECRRSLVGTSGVNTTLCHYECQCIHPCRFVHIMYMSLQALGISNTHWQLCDVEISVLSKWTIVILVISRRAKARYWLDIDPTLSCRIDVWSMSIWIPNWFISCGAIFCGIASAILNDIIWSVKTYSKSLTSNL